MTFQKSTSMKIFLPEEQAKQLCSPGEIERACGRGDVLAFDIYAGEELVGFAMLRKYDEGGYFLWNYAVDRAHQNRRIGTESLKALIRMMREEYGLCEMTTTYLFGNERARRLYESAGFVETDTVDEPGCHEVNMILRCGGKGDPV